MKTRISSAGVLAALFLAVVGLPAFGQDAAAIVERARNRIEADTTSTRSRMVITAKDGKTSERMIDQYSKESGGRTLMLIEFKRPASVAGTRFLTIENQAGGEDRWIYLPSLGKTRRVAASEGGGSFMGTDFSYDDISSTDRDIDADTHTILREETLDGVPCYVVQSVPRDSGYQYAKTISWIDKAQSLIYKNEMYNKRGELVKTMEMSDYRDVQGRPTAMRTKVATIASGTSTTVFMDIVRYDDTMPDGVFTVNYLETGRIR
ncbi:MAG: outer membrane lipoprotein-sorting protein [Spirochaetaceae bacterium]|jgi:outer membrane lipoprotein-sorting protein|nr:outer membrane lipoprotein-sorting protein [Spirochaetaceae bacterium]